MSGARWFLGAVLLLAAAGPLPPAAADAQVRYDTEYPSISYTAAPTANRVARLQDRLSRGEARLEHRGARGHFDSLLEALEISPSSQVLVYSKTSLQLKRISAATPRAIYFNDDTYVAWVQGSSLAEIATMDAAIGLTFYTFDNREASDLLPARENGRCLTCHDSQGMMGGGIPLLIARSAVVDVDGVRLRNEPARMVTDQTPFEERWGGWYVSGRHGGQVHLGNILAHDASALADLDALRRGNLDTLENAGLFDTTPYLAATSDIVALMLLEHQIGVQNDIIRVKFKAPFVLERTGHAALLQAQAWDELPPAAQSALLGMLDQLVSRLLLVDAITLNEPIVSTSGFDHWYQAQGPRDAHGRSLRELDLESRLFRRSLSPLICSEAFDSLPPYAIDYVYRQIARALDEADPSETGRRMSAQERRELREILTAAKPEFAPYASGAGG